MLPILFVLRRLCFLKPVMTLAVEPRTMAEQANWRLPWINWSAEDPTLQMTFDEERGQTILSGMGELHLEVLIRRLHDEFQSGRARWQTTGGLP